jgi:hypothetical protein
MLLKMLNQKRIIKMTHARMLKKFIVCNVIFFNSLFSMLDNPFKGNAKKAAEYVASGKQIEPWMIEHSIFHKNLAVLRVLTMNNNIPLDRYPYDTFKTPLHDAAGRDAADIIHYLINEKRIDPNLLNRDKETPLISAVNGFHHEALKALLQYNINLQARNRYGKTALEMAKSTDDKIAIKLLSEAQK